MHLESIVILCAVCFYASVWSIGLNEEQLQYCIFLDKQDINFESKINKLESYFNIESPDYNSCRGENYKIMRELILTAAYGGPNDNFKAKTLMPYEIDWYLRLFSSQAVPLTIFGYLQRAPLLDVFDQLNFTKADVKQLIPSKGDITVNVATFLLMMLRMLPEGNGLSQKQLQQFIKLEKECSKIEGSLDPKRVQKIVNDLGLPTDKGKNFFRSGRPAGIEMMELLIMTAERTWNDYAKGEWYLTTKEVRKMMFNFKHFDKNCDGELQGIEAKTFMEQFLKRNNGIYPTTAIDFNETRINVVQYLLFLLAHKSSTVQDEITLAELLAAARI